MRKPAFCIWENKTQISAFVLAILIQVYLTITRFLGSINLDRVISETRYSNWGKRATNTSLTNIVFAITGIGFVCLRQFLGEMMFFYKNYYIARWKNIYNMCHAV